MIGFFGRALILCLLVSSEASASGKLDLMGGFYNLSAKSDRGKGNLSGPGSYMAAYHYNLASSWDFTAGYSLFFSGTISGDIGYGPDLGVSYFPLTSSKPLQIQTDRIYISSFDTLRPFVNFSFNQRQFQSVEASYAGFSVGGGAEYHWNSSYDLKALGRYQLLKGPSGSTGTYMDILVGISFGI